MPCSACYFFFSVCVEPIIHKENFFQKHPLLHSHDIRTLHSAMHAWGLRDHTVPFPCPRPTAYVSYANSIRLAAPLSPAPFLRAAFRAAMSFLRLARAARRAAFALAASAFSSSV